jgi:hypothetical protein
MVVSGTNVAEAATRLISNLLNAPDGHCSIRLVDGVFVFERHDGTARLSSQSQSFQ